MKAIYFLSKRINIPYTGIFMIITTGFFIGGCIGAIL
jgi:hypothetical protein